MVQTCHDMYWLNERRMCGVCIEDMKYDSGVARAMKELQRVSERNDEPTAKLGHDCMNRPWSHCGP